VFCFSELNPIENSTDNIATDTTKKSADKSNHNVRKRPDLEGRYFEQLNIKAHQLT
jgi:hypothetical protein